LTRELVAIAGEGAGRSAAGCNPNHRIPTDRISPRLTGRKFPRAM
jgi:hypothetical protein